MIGTEAAMVAMMQAKVVEKATVGSQIRYAWKEQITDLATGLWADLVGGRYGTTTVNYAIELNNADVDVGSNVHLRQRGLFDSQMLFEFNAGGAGGSTSASCGCSWLGGMTTSDCLSVTIDGVVADLKLMTSAGTIWTSASTVEICGTDYTVSFTRVTCGVPCLAITRTGGSGSGSTTYSGYWGCCECSYTTFSFPLQTLCPDSEATGNPCTNIVSIRVDRASCYEQAFNVSTPGCCPFVEDFPKYLCAEPTAGSDVPEGCILEWHDAGAYPYTQDAWYQIVPDPSNYYNTGLGTPPVILICAGAPPHFNLKPYGAGGSFPTAFSGPEGGVNTYFCNPNDAGYGALLYPWDDGCARPTTVTTDCGTVPRGLTITKLTGCSGINAFVPVVCGSTNNMEVNLGDGCANTGQRWRGFASCGGLGSGQSVDVYMECIDGAMTIDVVFWLGTTVAATIDSISYDPFLLEFSVIEPGNACCPSTGGTATFMVTE